MAAVNAAEPNVPPAPILSVDPSVPANVTVFDKVKVLDVVPPAIVNPVAAGVKEILFTDVTEGKDVVLVYTPFVTVPAFPSIETPVSV